jgi:N-acetylmuramoyl-L-alanine amidase
MSTHPYVVRSGDYLTAIAFRFGTTVDEIWADPANAELKKRRANPEILAPGDVVFVPETHREWLPVETGAQNKYTARRPVVTVRVILRSPDGKALANQSVTTSPPSSVPLKTDGDGLLVCAVSFGARVLDVSVDGTSLRFQLRRGQSGPD